MSVAGRNGTVYAHSFSVQVARVILRSRPPVPPSIAASAGEALQHRFILRDVKQSAWRREVRVLEIALFAPRVCPYKFFSGDRNRRLCLGVDRKLREVFLSEIFPTKFLLVVRQRSRAERLQTFVNRNQFARLGLS